MHQSKQLITQLKLVLKEHKKNYRDVALALNLSEASVKRIFSDGDMTLSRLETLCQWLGISFADLIKRTEHALERMQQLSVDQEYAIANDLLLLLITVCVLNRWSFQEIIENYDIKEAYCLKKLLILDKMGLIELLPNNRIKLRTSPNFSWINNGPIQKFFQQRIASAYFDLPFSAEDEQLIVLNGMLSEHANKQFQKSMMRLKQDFEALNDDDAHLPLNKRDGYSAIISVRGWKHGIFSHITEDLGVVRKKT